MYTSISSDELLHIGLIWINREFRINLFGFIIYQINVFVTTIRHLDQALYTYTSQTFLGSCLYNAHVLTCCSKLIRILWGSILCFWLTHSLNLEQFLHWPLLNVTIARIQPSKQKSKHMRRHDTLKKMRSNWILEMLPLYSNLPPPQKKKKTKIIYTRIYCYKFTSFYTVLCS